MSALGADWPACLPADGRVARLSCGAATVWRDEASVREAFVE